MKIINQQVLTFCIAIVLLVNCNNANHERETDLKEEGGDSLIEKKLETKEEQSAIDTFISANLEKSDSLPVVKTENNINEITKGRLAGEHSLTIQWISWDKPGEITFNTIGNNQYEVDGFQEGAQSDECPKCYLKVTGTMVEITPKKLRFTGKIESSINHIQDGNPCIKEGTFDFVSSGKRNYWRCQNMTGCDGVTDYVDIYF